MPEAELSGLNPKRKGVVGFRVIHAEDTAFLRALYDSTRAWEFEQTTWSPVEKEDFLKRQFTHQDLHYQRAFPGAVRRIITLDRTDIGRLYVDRQDTCLRIIEFTLAPEARGRGIGTDILRSLMNEAHGGKVPVLLHVEKNSPALRLYLRHGFTVIAEEGHHYEMKWQPHTGPREI